MCVWLLVAFVFCPGLEFRCVVGVFFPCLLLWFLLLAPQTRRRSSRRQTSVDHQCCARAYSATRTLFNTPLWKTALYLLHMRSPKDPFAGPKMSLQPIPIFKELCASTSIVKGKSFCSVHPWIGPLIRPCYADKNRLLLCHNKKCLLSMVVCERRH